MAGSRSYTVLDDGYRLSDELWGQIEPPLPLRPSHPLGCHNPPKPARQVMDAILFVLRTGCQWNALNATGICSSSVAHRRFQEWARAGVFEALWQQGLLAYDALVGIDWTWLALDGSMGKAPLGGEKTGPNPTDRAKRGTKRSLLTDARGTPLSVVVDGANRNDHILMPETLAAIPVARPEPTPDEPQHLCLDKGYDYQEPRDIASRCSVPRCGGTSDTPLDEVLWDRFFTAAPRRLRRSVGQSKLVKRA